MDVEIKIGIIQRKENKNYEIEKKILLNLIEYFNKEYKKDNFNIIQNTMDYTTLKYNNFDIVRLKYTNKTKWIKLFLTPSDKYLYINNDLFSAQKNKNEFYWKSLLYNEDDIIKYSNIIRNCINYIIKQNNY